MCNLGVAKEKKTKAVGKLQGKYEVNENMFPKFLFPALLVVFPWQFRGRQRKEDKSGGDKCKESK